MCKDNLKILLETCSDDELTELINKAKSEKDKRKDKARRKAWENFLNAYEEYRQFDNILLSGVVGEDPVSFEVFSFPQMGLINLKEI